MGLSSFATPMLSADLVFGICPQRMLADRERWEASRDPSDAIACGRHREATGLADTTTF